MTHQDFIARILADPADDTPRAKYADWLREQPDPALAVRGEFIAVQLEKARVDHDRESRLAGAMMGPPYEDLCRRERGLLEAHGPEWQDGLPGEPLDYMPGTASFRRRLGDATAIFVWRRGFVERVECSCADWLSHGPAIVAAQPVTEVRLTDRRPLHDGDEATEERWYSWITNDGLEASADDRRIPLAWADELPEWPWPRYTPYRWRYPTEADAHAALSTAAVAWARNAAGLPPIPRGG